MSVKIEKYEAYNARRLLFVCYAYLVPSRVEVVLAVSAALQVSDDVVDDVDEIRRQLHAAWPLCAIQQSTMFAA